MKKKSLIIVTVVTYLLISTSCNHKNTSTTQKPETKDIHMANDISSKILKQFPNKNVLNLIKSSILKFSVVEYINEKWVGASSGHCCLYSTDNISSYLALPTHCFVFDSKKKYEVFLTDCNGKAFKASCKLLLSSTTYDAEIMEIGKIKLASLCEMGLIANHPTKGDSVVLLVPFNARRVYQKFGSFIDSTSAIMNTLALDHGDSGGLMIGRDGVMGVAISSFTENIRGANFVPMSVFEDIFIDLTERKQQEIISKKK